MASEAIRTSRAPFAAHRASIRSEILLDLRGRPVELDDQHGATVRRIVRVHRGLGRLDRDRVHHLDRGGQDPRGDRARDGRSRSVRVLEPGEHRPHALGGPQNPQGQAGGDAQRSLRADEDTEQTRPVVPHRELDELAVGQHDVGGQHVVDGEAVLQAVRAAGVLGDVAADRADLLRRRVRRVVEAVRRDRLRHVEIGHAGLDDDVTGVDVDLEDPVHPGQ